MKSGQSVALFVLMLTFNPMRTPELFPLYFICMWFAVTFMLSRIGWVYLAREFAYEGKFNGSLLGIFSGRVNGITYRNGLSIRYNHEGIYLRPVLILRMFHRPILVPWHKVEMNEIRLLWKRYELYLSHPVPVSVFLSKNDAERMRQYIDL